MNMSPQEMIDFLLEKKEEGKVAYYTLPDTIAVSTLEEFCKQSADGILYDLNRDEASVIVSASVDNRYWVNNFATAQVIRHLKGRVEELEKLLEKEGTL